MREDTSIFPHLERIGQNAQLRLFPILAKLPAAERQSALRTARSTEFDSLERLGLIALVGVCAYLLQSVGEGVELHLVRVLVRLLLALPLMGILAVPWMVRRTRRGLRRQIGPS